MCLVYLMFYFFKGIIFENKFNNMILGVIERVLKILRRIFCINLFLLKDF